MELGISAKLNPSISSSLFCLDSNALLMTIYWVNIFKGEIFKEQLVKVMSKVLFSNAQTLCSTMCLVVLLNGPN